MHVVVWQFAGVTRSNGDGWAAALVEQLTDAGASVEVVNPSVSDPTRLVADGHVLSGGATVPGSTPASRQALVHTARLVAAARHTAIPVVGVCLGAQMLATVIGGAGMSGPSPLGTELGIVDVDDADGTRWTTATFHNHMISPRLAQTAGVRVAASNRHTQVQAFTYRSICAVQFHPELDREQLAAAVDANPSWVYDAAATAARIRNGRQRPPATVQRWLLGPLGLGSPTHPLRQLEPAAPSEPVLAPWGDLPTDAVAERPQLPSRQ